MDTKRLREIDRKIKRYEGIDILLSHDLQEKDNDTVDREKSGNAASQNHEEREDEQG
ncbi:MAG: hypothetical protein LBE13_00740 [Bacteroidales bacterium]|jgi:hypothetical protein|nr:hypothetical protein [Bacteroidales bacterium]